MLLTTLSVFVLEQTSPGQSYYEFDPRKSRAVPKVRCYIN